MLFYELECCCQFGLYLKVRYTLLKVLEESVFNQIEANSTVFHVVSSLCLIGLALGISLCTDCLGVVLELNVSERSMLLVTNHWIVVIITTLMISA